MSSVRKYDVIAKIGEYGPEGDKKARWLNCGAVIENEKGLSLKLECTPVGNDWNGWFVLKTPSERKPENGSAGSSGSTDKPTAKPTPPPSKKQEKIEQPAQSAQPADKDDENLPF